MKSYAPHRSIGARQTSRPDLLCFEILGKIAEEDIEWMARGVEDAVADRQTIDILLIMRHYDGAELSAVLNPEALKVQTKSIWHVRKYGVVGAPAWAKAMINLFAPLSPVEAKTFDLDDEEQAWAWIEQPSAPAD
jgi:hypothetical protein